ncbi:hypothetical protein [Myceligenerans pegani]|uniref:Uncharacterized protein n=1 Tax=Myceligenerans pegani TaxID=2776917 RepID=A0ABR9N4T6_9MICO|nr:hypothetical protein [Myceligenerans sp. TRM 65318]MBE1878668.1 hypothetical protein [Myceligenerans sp. TRM 65318]MBE3020939.1 hypothetical protein [Myceligenerans sp. TRM 65318]
MTAVVDVRERGWWRRNAIWLAVLPLMVAAAAAAWSFRLMNLWWPTELVERVDSVGAGETAHFVGDYYDLGLTDPALANTWVTREVDVRVLDVREVDGLPQSVLAEIDRIPDGAAAWRVELELTAEPGTDLGLCQVMLVTSDGTRYGEASKAGTRPDPLGQGNPCMPPDSMDSIAPEAGTWQVSTVLLTRAGDTPDEIWFSFGNPHYVTLDVP